MSSKFHYVTYIRSTPEKVWEALTSPDYTKKYWFGMVQDCAWQPGASWALRGENDVIWDSGSILELEKPRRIVIAWQHQKMPEFKEDGLTRCTIDIETKGELVKLSIEHVCDKDNAKVIAGVGSGWPQIISSLKSLLETGTAL